MDRELQAQRMKFLATNLVKGLLWLAVLVAAYIFARRYLNLDFEEMLGPLWDNPTLIFSIFLASEVIFGIIPPELFMFWALRNEVLSDYLGNVTGLALISYFAGIIGYYIGSYFNTTRFYRLLKRRVFGKFEKHFNTYGGFLKYEPM
jgi:membrane protein DedA with SNARE-associated domain